MINCKLIEDKVIVSKPKEVGRLYNKSHFGKPLTGGSLELDLLESVFLIDENKIKIFEGKKSIDFEKIVKIASKKINDFEILYQAFKDLRKRGYAIKLSNKKDITFQHFKEKIYIIVYYEQSKIELSKLADLIKKYRKDAGSLWLAIVDEEGDITYYNTEILDINGENKQKKYPKTKATMLKEKVIIFNEKISKDLFEKEFFGKKFGPGLQLSIIEALYLSNRGIVEKKDIKNIDEKQKDLRNRLFVYEDLKKRGLLVKTGFKFGTHFRAYTKSPDKTHAQYLIHVLGKQTKSLWSEISRAVRLAHSVNKEICFAIFKNKKIYYVKFGRLRP